MFCGIFYSLGRFLPDIQCHVPSFTSIIPFDASLLLLLSAVATHAYMMFKYLDQKRRNNLASSVLDPLLPFFHMPLFSLTD
jgi:hypothetical protein